MKILVISDNHGHPPGELMPHVRAVDEIWHAGDMGTFTSIQPMLREKKLRGVYGNIDGTDVRLEFPERQSFECAGLKVLMVHIAGNPGKYPAKIKQWIRDEKADIFVCGHSHICKVMKDAEMGHWHMNPGAYGHHGFHHMRTALLLHLDQGQLLSLSVLELGKRGRPDKEMTQI